MADDETTPDDSDEAILKEARDALDLAQSVESENRKNALDDVRFSRLGEQWPSEIKAQREAEARPCLTINRMMTFVRQVVNDSRQNKPQIKVKPVDSNSDPATAEVVNGLIRNIEYVSSADVAYDTAIDSAVSGGFGYIRVKTDYTYDDIFDLDIMIERVANPFSVYGDPHATSADGSDWMTALVTDRISKNEFKRRFKGKANVDFEGPEWHDCGDWLNDDGVLVAEYWKREEEPKRIFLLSDGNTVSEEDIKENADLLALLEDGTLAVVKERETKGYKVTQYILSGVEVLEKNDWPGCYIPIIPVYGDEFTIEGKRYFRSLIHPAKDAQRMLNYWRSTSTELVALAPRVPFIGPKSAFDSDIERWNTANTKSHAYLEYDGPVAPQRQPLDMGVAAGALQEALNAADDIKSTIGMYDASLGAKSNETSGRAIMARQREGDVATFHFIDNLSRAIRHVGRVVLDLIPHVYSGARVIRVLGEDGKEQSVPINQQYQTTDKQGRAIMAMHDLSAGKYDLAVEAGPSFTTRREETAAQITEMIRAYPPAAPILGGPLARNLDWPGADEIAEKLERLDPTRQQQLPPQIQQALQQGQALIAKLQAENAQLKADKQIDSFKAETDRMKVEGGLQIDQLKTGVDVLSKLSMADPMQPQGTQFPPQG